MARGRKKQEVRVTAEMRNRVSNERALVPADEVRRRREFIARLWTQGIPRRTITKLAKQELGVSSNKVALLLAEVRDDFIRDHEENRAAYKAQAVARIYDEIREARRTVYEEAFDKKAGKVVRTGRILQHPNHGAVASLERLLSDVQGTREPLQIHLRVDIQAAVVAAIGTMPLEQMDALVGRYCELEQRAQLAPAPAKSGGAAA